MAWTDLKAAVAAVIKTNGNQEITGALLQSTLNSIIDQVGANASYKGVAIPSTNPGSPDGSVFYIASTQGTYANFGGFVLDGGFAILSNVSGSWTGTKFLNENFKYVIAGWALSESFALSSPTFDNEGYFSGGVITWPDGDVGSISNVTTGTNGITSIRYNRSEAGKYATVNITYDSSGVVNNQEVVLTGF